MKLACSKAGGGCKGHDLENPVYDRFGYRGINLETQQHRDGDKRDSEQDKPVEEEFWVAKIVIDSTALPRGKMQRKINSGDKHKENGNNLDRRTIEVGHTCVMGRKAANRYCRKAVGNCIKPRHTRGPIGGGTGEGEAYVDGPKCFCRFGESRH